MASLIVKGGSKLFASSSRRSFAHQPCFSFSTGNKSNPPTQQAPQTTQKKPAAAQPQQKSTEVPKKESATPPSGNEGTSSFPQFEIPKVPFRLYGLTGEYATTLFEIAAKSQVLDLVEKELQLLKYYAVASPAISSVLTNPVISYEKRAKAINALGTGSYKFTPVTLAFLHLVAQNKRVPYTMAIFDDFGKLAKAMKNEVEGSVTSAKPLTHDEFEQIKRDIRYRYFKTDTKLNLTQKVDPLILGGIKIDVGQVHVDDSVASELARIKKEMEDSVKQFFARALSERPK